MKIGSGDSLAVRSIVIALVFVLSIHVGTARAGQDIEWLDQFGTDRGDQAAEVVADETGAYVVGSLGDPAAVLGTSAFLKRYNTNGTVAWTQRLGSSFWDAFSVGAYGEGVYVTGRPRGFVQRRDSSGGLVWTRDVACCDAWALDVAVDSSGVYVVGRLGFGALPGQTSSGFIDAYVQRYDHNGNLIWSHQFGSSGQDQAHGVWLHDGAVYVSGFAGGALPGATFNGGSDGFVRRLDLNGNHIWTRHVGTADFDDVGEVAADDTGVYVVGRTGGAFPGQTFVGEHDAFIRKFDSGGNELWTRQFGTIYPDALGSITVDSTGIYVGGWTYGALVLPVLDRSNAAIARKYDQAGNVIWTYQFPRYSFTQDIANDGSGLYVVGTVESAFPGQTFNGVRDAFVTRLISFPNRTPVAVAGPDQLVSEGTTVVLNGSASTDPDYDTLTYAWTLLSSEGPSVTLDDASTVTASFFAPDEGVYTLRLTVTDPSGERASADIRVEVFNANPDATILGPASGAVYAVGAGVELAGTFAEPGASDTHTANWTLSSGDVTTIISGSVTEADGAGSVTASHIFEAPGIYSIALEVTDNDGGTTSVSTVDGLDAFVVVFDPSGGHVTGGGWINVPAGAYQPDPSLEGRATFGFVARYSRGVQTPSGDTYFRFAMAGLDFRSKNYEWLVVSGARAKFKGTGTVNGAGTFDFTLSAVDGARSSDGVDRFRIKIWDRDSGGLIFDNDVGSDGSDASTAIGGGSIVVHP